jgi:hypothetical protein
MVEGNEVDDVWPDRGLAAKTTTGLTTAQLLPELALRVSHVLAQPARPFDLKLAHRSRCSERKGYPEWAPRPS